MYKSKIIKPNRNKKTESVRVPVHCIDMVRKLSTVKGQSVQDTFIEIMTEWIMYKQTQITKGGL